MRQVFRCVFVFLAFIAIAFIPFASAPVSAQVNPCINGEGGFQATSACRSVQTDETLGSFFGKCQVNTSPSTAPTETDSNQLTECIQQVLQVILIISIIWIIIKITASNLGVIGKFGDGENPVEETRKALQSGLTGILLIAGVTLLLGLFNSGTLNAGFLDFGAGRLAVDVPEPTPVSPRTPNNTVNAPPLGDPAPAGLVLPPQCGYPPGPPELKQGDPRCVYTADPSPYGIFSFHLPFAGSGRVTSLYGLDSSYPANLGYTHSGADFAINNREVLPIAGTLGSRRVTTIAKKVPFVEGQSSFGEYIVLKHEEDGVVAYSLYAHLEPGSLTENTVGTSVNSLDKLGTQGRSGLKADSYDEHLHLQIYDSNYSLQLDKGVAQGGLNCKKFSGEPPNFLSQEEPKYNCINPFDVIIGI